MEVNRSRRGGTYPSFEIFNLTEFKYMNDGCHSPDPLESLNVAAFLSFHSPPGHSLSR